MMIDTGGAPPRSLPGNSVAAAVHTERVIQAEPLTSVTRTQSSTMTLSKLYSVSLSGVALSRAAFRVLVDLGVGRRQ
eukprot:96052-Rhodomonas_salina.1